MKTSIKLAAFLAVVVLAIACGKPKGDDGRSAEEREQSAKTDQTAKKGALARKEDPAADLKHQRANLARLRQNAEENRLNGNRIGTWAAEQDAKSVEKLIAKDRQAVPGSGEGQ